jgi:hypothetical protein
MKSKVLVGIISGLAIVLLTSCAPFENVAVRKEVDMSSPYYAMGYNSKCVATVCPGTVLDFLARDKTDENLYIEDIYECEQFAADLWWNAYNEGMEGCIVWVYTNPGFHAVVKFNTTDGWLWVDPEIDFVSSKCWYEVWMTFCGENAFNKCINTIERKPPMVDVGLIK